MKWAQKKINKWLKNPERTNANPNNPVPNNDDTSSSEVAFVNCAIISNEVNDDNSPQNTASLLNHFVEGYSSLANKGSWDLETVNTLTHVDSIPVQTEFVRRTDGNPHIPTARSFISVENTDRFNAAVVVVDPTKPDAYEKLSDNLGYLAHYAPHLSVSVIFTHENMPSQHAVSSQEFDTILKETFSNRFDSSITIAHIDASPNCKDGNAAITFRNMIRTCIGEGQNIEALNPTAQINLTEDIFQKTSELGKTGLPQDITSLIAQNMFAVTAQELAQNGRDDYLQTDIGKWAEKHGSKQQEQTFQQKEAAKKGEENKGIAGRNT